MIKKISLVWNTVWKVSQKYTALWDIMTCNVSWDDCTVYLFFPLLSHLSELVIRTIIFLQICVCCVCSTLSHAAVLFSLAALSSLYALMIRLLPFLRLSLMRQKATWGMTGPTWLTLAALASAMSFSFAENRWQLIMVKKSSMGHSLFYSFFFFKIRIIQCSSLKLGGAEMLSGQLLVSLVYCHIIITVLWLCFGNRQLMKTFGTTCHADA